MRVCQGDARSVPKESVELKMKAIFMRDIDIHERGGARGMMHGQRDYVSSSPVLICLGRDVMPKVEKITVSIYGVQS
jgi:hypothetical protein